MFQLQFGMPKLRSVSVAQSNTVLSLVLGALRCFFLLSFESTLLRRQRQRYKDDKKLLQKAKNLLGPQCQPPYRWQQDKKQHMFWPLISVTWWRQLSPVPRSVLEI